MSALKKTPGEIRPPALPSNLANGKAGGDEYNFNSVGFYSDLLTRLDTQIRDTEELYKQSFYKVSSYHRHDSLNHFVRSDH
jgi:hypothetical protein